MKNAEMSVDHELEKGDETRTLLPDLELRSLLGPIVGAEVGISGGLT